MYSITGRMNQGVNAQGQEGPIINRSFSTSVIYNSGKINAQSKSMRQQLPVSVQMMDFLSAIAADQQSYNIFPILPEGSLSYEQGFLESVDTSRPLPEEFQLLENVGKRVPELIQQFALKETVDALPLLDMSKLPVRDLPRAATILSTIAHAYQYHYRQPSSALEGVLGAELPDVLQKPWDQVCQRLRQSPGVRRNLDDFLNNAIKPYGRDTDLHFPYFGMAGVEETETSAIQAKMEDGFIQPLTLLLSIQTSILNNKPEALNKDLFKLADHLNDLSVLQLDMNPRVGPRGVDPVIWFKTYPEAGLPVNKHEIENSGIDNPMFHALDAFFGRYRDKSSTSELKAQQARRIKKFTPAHRAFIRSLADERIDLEGFIRKNCAHETLGALDQVKMAYRNLLEGHRKKAVGALDVMFATGQSYKQMIDPKNPALKKTEKMVGHINHLMLDAIQDRFKTMKEDVAAKVSLQWKGGNVRIYELALEQNISCRPGDRIAIKVNNSDGLSLKNYSIARVFHDSAGGINKVHLMVNHNDKASGPQYLENAVKSRQSIDVVPVFSAEFRMPHDTQTPVIMIGQGSGTAGFLAFLNDEAVKGSERDRILLGGYKQLVSVPYLNELIAGTENSHGRIQLALSEEGRIAHIENGGISFEAAKGRPHVQDMFAQNLKLNHLLQKSAQLFICGSNSFIDDVHASLAKVDEPIVHGTNAERALPAIPSYNMNLHEESYTPAKSASGQTFSVADVASHNKADDLWSFIGDKVFDLTKYGMRHPGGIKPIMHYAGISMERKFNQIHGEQSQMVEGLLAQFEIGRLRESDMRLLEEAATDNPSAAARNVINLERCVEAQNIADVSTHFAPGRDIPYFLLEKSLKQMPGWLQTGLVNAGLYESAGAQGWADTMKRIESAVETFSSISQNAIQTATREGHFDAESRQRIDALYSIFDQVADMIKQHKTVLQATHNAGGMMDTAAVQKEKVIVQALESLDQMILKAA